MPSRNSLPPEISALVEFNALPMSDSRLDFDVGRLVSAIDKVISPQVTSAPKLFRNRWIVFGGLSALLLVLALVLGREVIAPRVNSAVSQDRSANSQTVAPKQDEVLATEPFVVFEYDLTNGWKARNIGKTPALDVLVSERSFAGSWAAPVRLPPLAPGEERWIDWVRHRNVDVLGARYNNAQNQVFSAICQNDRSLVQRGSVFPPWKEAEIRAFWKGLEVNQLAGAKPDAPPVPSYLDQRAAARPPSPVPAPQSVQNAGGSLLSTGR